MAYQADMDQIDELLVNIMEHKIAGVTGASVVYSWMGRRIQPQQKRSRFHFEYLGISNTTWFIADKILQSEAVRLVS
ncbi:hypothetical protein C2845_PM18G06070 [Panicum miliaceum]|uniref:Uncharacterized protein n=1 Tax=Panicum miliaceum TaxID=4540 RepID=A0A3L6PL09_PANMI|nr:hypothetical protein C2845_PM18G06070 [Panicum miliaceum]